MMTGAIAMVPTPLVVCVATYVVGVYVSFVVIGWQSADDKMDGLDAFAAVVWPLTLPIVGFIILGDSISSWYEGWSSRHPVAVRRISAVLFALTLPFRPWRIGRLTRGKK